MELEECRREIDVLDRDLTKILERRMQVVAEVAAYKKEHHMEIYDPRRERQVLDKIANLTVRRNCRRICGVFISASWMRARNMNGSIWGCEDGTNRSTRHCGTPLI